MHNRLERGRLNKAKRGELILDVPCGYVKLPGGGVALDPDEQVQATVKLVFDKFDELGSCRRLYRYLVRNKIRLGIRVHRGPRRGQLEWRRPLRACSLGCCIIRSTQGPIPTDVAAWITSGRLRWRQGQDARDADVGVDGAPAGSPAGLHHVGTIPERSCSQNLQ